MSALDSQTGGDHYKHFKIQPIEFTMKNGLGFCEGNIVKYVTRHKLKNKAEDLKKVIHYAQLLIELEYGEKPQQDLPIEDNNLMDKSLSQLANFVVHHQKFELIFKAILNQALSGDLQNTENLINEVVTHFRETDNQLTQLSDIKTRE